MKYFVTAVLILYCLLLAAMGLSTLLLPSAPLAEYPNTTMVVLDPTLAAMAPLWQAEIDRRFHGAVGVICHGGDFVSGQWITSNKNYGHFTTAVEVAEHFKAAYPGRVIVLLACNTGHVRLGVSGVYYAPSFVWCIPDRNVKSEGDDSDETMTPGPVTKPAPPQVLIRVIRIPPAPTRWEQHPDYVGNVFEMICD